MTRHVIAALSLILPVAAGAAGGLSLEATGTRRLLPGGGPPAGLVVRGPPAQLRRLEVGCTHGHPREIASRATHTERHYELVPPSTPVPASWVLCGAGAPGGQALVALELLRRETLPLSLLPPLARVEVRIGGALYGPVRANGAGVAEVPVLLTPSALKAEVTAAPPGGEAQSTTVRLAVNPGEQVLVLPSPRAITADGLQSTSLYLFTLDERGEAADLPATVSSEDGSVALARRGPGLQLITFTPHARAARGEAQVAAWTARSRQSVVRVPLVAGVKPSLSIEAPVRGLPADGVASVEVSVRVTDPSGRRLIGQPVKLAARSGWVSPLAERPDGTYGARYVAPVDAVGETELTAELEGAQPASLPLILTPPPRLTAQLTPREIPADGRSRAVLSITVRGPDGRLAPDGSEVELSATLGTLPPLVTTAGGTAIAELLAGQSAGEVLISVRSRDATQTVSTRMLPGPAARLEVRPERPVLVCDGRDATLLRVRVRDAFGNPIEGLPLALSDDPGGGRFERVAALGGGEFSFRYTAPATCEPRRRELTAAAGGARGSAWVSLRRGYSRPLGLAIRVGGAQSLAQERSGQLEVEGDARTQGLGGQLLASITASLSHALDPLGRGPGWTASLYLGPKWSFVEDERLFLYLGSGLDAHAALGEGALEAAWFGAHLRAGGGWALGPGFGTLQLRFGYLFQGSGRVPQALPGGLSLSAGYQLPL